jgi:hypothetical protein
VGIDSLSAMLFRNYLSRSLGCVTVSLELLYDPDITIESSSEHVFDSLARTDNHKAEGVLERLGITTATRIKNKKANPSIAFTSMAQDKFSECSRNTGKAHCASRGAVCC